MAGNTIGKLFTVTTSGESHGPGLSTIIDGCPPGLAISETDIQKELNKRRPGQSRFTSQRKETDEVSIMSGVFEGVTTGTPINLVVQNVDQKSKDYTAIKDKFRPGHADFTYYHKYGIRDYRGGGRSSARETVMRVAAGAIARKYLLERLGLSIHGYLAQLGSIKLEAKDFNQVNQNPFFCADPDRLPELESFMDKLRKAGDSIGARINIVATGVPHGLGEPVFDKLDADIAKALMSINAVKGVEIGAGFDVVKGRGTEQRDEMTSNGFVANHAGGILGGISTGQDIVVNIALKPTSSITTPARTIDVDGRDTEIVTKGRHDPCVGVRATPIAEAMLAIVLLDHFLRQRGQNADSSPSL